MTPTPEEAGLPPLTPMLREALLGLAARIDYAYGDPIAIGVEAADAIRAALAAQQQRQAAPIDWMQYDDELRFVQRVLESQAPEADRKAAREMILRIRTSIRPAPPLAASPDVQKGGE